MGLLQTHGWAKKPKTTACSRAGHCSLLPASPSLRATEIVPKVCEHGAGAI